MKEEAEKLNLPVLAELPIDPRVAEALDRGDIESLRVPELENAIRAVENA